MKGRGQILELEVERKKREHKQFLGSLTCKGWGKKWAETRSHVWLRESFLIALACLVAV